MTTISVFGGLAADLIVEHTRTCYQGDRSQRHDWGYSFGEWPRVRPAG